MTSALTTGDTPNFSLIDERDSATEAVVGGTSDGDDPANTTKQMTPVGQSDAVTTPGSRDEGETDYAQTGVVGEQDGVVAAGGI